jgi:hypothetical protein
VFQKLGIQPVTFPGRGGTIFKSLIMDKHIEEMEGKILLLENKKFVVCLGVIAVYYVSFLCVLARVIILTGGFQ